MVTLVEVTAVTKLGAQMQVYEDRDESRKPPSYPDKSDWIKEQMRAVAYSMDTLAPGFYLWIFGFPLRLGGTTPDDSPYRYPGTINSRFGVAVVLPGYRIFTTYSGSYDAS